MATPSGAAAANSTPPASNENGWNENGWSGEGDGEWSPEAEEAPSVEQLKQEFMRDQRLIATIKQQWYGEEHGMRVRAEEQMERSKQAWQDAKPATSVARRMQRAEQAVGKARVGQARLEQELDNLDTWYEVQRKVKYQQLQEARARTTEKEEALAEISREAANGDAPPQRGGPGRAAMRASTDAINADIGPTLQALLAEFPEGSDAHAKLAATMQTLGGLRDTLAQAAQEEHDAELFDIATEEHEGGAWDGWGDQWQGWNYGRDGEWEWDESDGWHPRDEQQLGMDTSDVQVPYWMRSQSEQDGTTLGRAWKRGHDGTAAQSGTQGRHAAAASGDDLEAIRAHEAVATLQASLQDAAHNDAGTQGATARADAALDARRQQVWDQAQLESVAVAYQDIASASAEELEKWALENLGSTLRHVPHDTTPVPIMHCASLGGEWDTVRRRDGWLWLQSVGP